MLTSHEQRDSVIVCGRRESSHKYVVVRSYSPHGIDSAVYVCGGDYVEDPYQYAKFHHDPITFFRPPNVLKFASNVVFQTIVANKLLYASPAWWGFASADDRNRLEEFQQRSAIVLHNDIRQYAHRC